MDGFIAVIILICVTFTAGLAVGNDDGRKGIGNDCLKTGQFTIHGNVFSCERIKVKDTI